MIFARSLVRFAVDSALILVVAALASAALVRFAPGADVDIREQNAHFSADTLEKIRAEKQAKHSFVLGSVRSFSALVRGDFGVSDTSGLPVSELMKGRIPITMRTVVTGAVLGFVAGVVIAISTVLVFPGIPEMTAAGAFLALLSLPAGLLALAAVVCRLPIEVAVALAVVPRVYFYAARLFAQHGAAPYVIAAVCAGTAPFRLIVRHILPALRSELAAIGGFSLVTALGATIPAEVLSGQPGIGYLAWQSAMERDMPVVIAVTTVMVVISRLVTFISAMPATDPGNA